MSGPARVRAWLTEAALPLWADAGRDRAGGGFVERLFPDGSPDLAATKRVRVQARQVYVYAHAAVLGLMPGADVVAGAGYDFLMRHAAPDGIACGFVHALAPDGGVRDMRRDSYDHAFLLLAFSWFYRATGRADVLKAVMALGAAIPGLFAHPGGAGYRIDAGPDAAIHQNPNMHLLEAWLAAYDATGEAAFLARADALVALFRAQLFDAERGVLREYFDADGRPAAGEAGRVVEPGHQCEWAWLLAAHAARHGRAAGGEGVRMHDFALRHGRPGGGVLLCDELWDDGGVRSANLRLWPQTERLKAEIALAEAAGEAPDETAEAIVAATFATFLDPAVPGAWVDRVDAGGRPLVATVPASSLYHLFLGFAEYLRVGG